MGFNMKLSISNGFGCALGKFATFCCFNSLNLTRQRERPIKRVVAKFQWNRLRHLFFFFKSVMSARPIMGVYFKDKKPRKFDKFPQNRAQIAGDDKYTYSYWPKNCHSASWKTYSLTLTVICAFVLYFLSISLKNLMGKGKWNMLYGKWR